MPQRVGSAERVTKAWRGLVMASALAAVAGLPMVHAPSSTASAQVLEPESNPAPAPGVRTSPSIQLETTTLDVGRLFDTDQPVAQVIRFTNNGTAPLEIVDVSASCGCTAGKPDKRFYQPGESGEIEVTFNPRNRNGQQRTRVTIRTNDPVRPSQVINVSAFVQKRVILEPALINFQRIAKGEGTSQTLQVTGRGEHFEIEEIAFLEGDHFSAKILSREPVEIEGEDGTMIRYTLEVTISPDAPVGTNHDRIRLRTNEGRGEESGGDQAQTVARENPREATNGAAQRPLAPIDIAITSSVLGEIVTTPDRVTLRGVQAGRAFTSQIRITHRSRGEFRILDSKVTMAGVKEEDLPGVVIQPAPEGGYRVLLNGVGPANERFVRGEIILTTNVRGEEELRIPFFGNVVNVRR